MILNRFMALLAIVCGVSAAGPAFASDAEDGAKVFKKCTACHSIEPGVNKVGPTLSAVIGRKCGTIEGYKYGKGYLKACESGFVIDEAFLEDYLKDPSAKLTELAGARERSKMTFKLKKDDDIDDVIEYLKTQ